MFTKEAITALQEGTSIIAANACLESTEGLAALPSDYKLHDQERHQPYRRRARGNMATRFIKPFAAYVEAHAEAGTTVFIDPKELGATAVLNLGTPELPGHADNTAQLALHRTAAYTALLSICAQPHDQSAVAEFLEDWPEHITCFNNNDEIKRPLAIAAVRKITIDSSRKSESEEQQLGASRSAFESVHASSKDPLPTTIYFSCQPYADLKSHQFVLRLGVLTSEAKPKLTLRIQKAELHNEEMAKELANLLTEAFGKNTKPVLIGQYKKAD